MSAEILRRAASLMRERAEAATPGPWMVDDDHPHIVMKPDKPGFSWDGTAITTIQEGDFGLTDHTNAEHIASWHPAVALAVADWLDLDADSSTPDDYDESQDVWRMFALKVARAYLQEASDV